MEGTSHGPDVRKRLELPVTGEIAVRVGVEVVGAVEIVVGVVVGVVVRVLVGGVGVVAIVAVGGVSNGIVFMGRGYGLEGGAHVAAV